MSDEKKPWHKQPQEPSFWFERFKKWLKQDKPRSLLSIWNQDREQRGLKRTDTVATNWRLAFEKYQWAERGEAWDKAEQERKDKEWKEKREQQRLNELDDAADLRGKAKEMVALPVTAEMGRSGGEWDEPQAGAITVIKPANSQTFKHAAEIFLASSTLARKALGMVEKAEEQRLTDSQGKDIKGARGIFIFPPVPQEEADSAPSEGQEKAVPPESQSVTVVIAGKAKVLLPEVSEERD